MHNDRQEQWRTLYKENIYGAKNSPVILDCGEIYGKAPVECVKPRKHAGPIVQEYKISFLLSQFIRDTFHLDPDQV